MAGRPVFIPVLNGELFVKTTFIQFPWFPGMSISQKQKSVESLHSAASKITGMDRMLEVSSKSKDELGVALSSFNLMITTIKNKKKFSVECAFQGSKVFENGGPYTDLFDVTSREAKKDERIRSSGHLLCFRFFGVEWELEPQTAFYDWLYISALRKHPSLTERLSNYSAFTDIEFNPERSINCQAYSVALYLSLLHRGILEDAISSKDAFLKTIRSVSINNSKRNETIQKDLGLFN
ncbi:MAG: hypothetical protein ABSH53_06590 [Holophaga sp.]|jgi:hypothetical protein